MPKLTLLGCQPAHGGSLYCGPNVLTVPGDVAVEFNNRRYSVMAIDPLEVIDTALELATTVPRSNVRAWEDSKAAWVISPDEIDLYSYDGVIAHAEQAPQLTLCDVGVSCLAYYLWRQRQARPARSRSNVIDLSSYRSK